MGRKPQKQYALLSISYPGLNKISFAGDVTLGHWIQLILGFSSIVTEASLVAQRLKRLPPMWETRVRSLGLEDPLEKEMAIHSRILAWRIPWTEKPSRL